MIFFLIFILLASSIIGIFLLNRVLPLNSKYLNLLSFQYLYQCIFLVVPGAIVILLGVRTDLALKPVSDKTIYLTSYLICWSVVAFPATIAFWDLVTKQRIYNLILDYKKRECAHYNNEFITRKNISIVSIINTIFLLFFLSLLPVIPIFHIGSGSEFIMNSRIESAFDLPSWVYGFRRVLIYFLPIFFLYTLALRNIIHVPRWVLFINGVNAIFILGYSTEKAPLLYLILAVFFLKNNFNNYNLSFGRLLPIGGAVFGILFLMFMFFYNNEINDVLSLLFGRLFVAQIAGSYLSVEYYGNIAPFKFFDAILFRIDSLLGNVPTMQTSEELVWYYYRDLYDSNLWKNVNSFIIQGAWANFGIIGVILAPIWCASIIYFCCIYLFKRAKTASSLAVYSYSAIFMVSLSTNFNNFIYSSGFILTILIWFFIRKL